ncbi:family 16 glycosylhydrolase [Halothermothrix orenii]|uniref:Glucan endo-1,3-beta-D-glucosidase n=1 Tax=Halothermothrix orenii (strain H 168 / OCM 544 / DSM 9562) TaxID=373903 RepID=B8D1V5_HALOH|nr:family 16 glycosylhydrolase [Halothermothrix orenii]ACL69182.1 Glucan endo-1,3-beta-D-glucosidase [Halothermothrix orenii H 168]
MKIRQNKVWLVATLGLIMLLVLAGCKSGVSEGTSSLLVNVQDGNSQTEIKVLDDSGEVASKTGKTAKFELSNGVYKVEVGNKIFDVYLTGDTTLDVILGEDENLIGSGFFNEPLSNKKIAGDGYVDTEGNWVAYLNTGGGGRATVKNGRVIYQVTNAGSQPYSVQLIQAPVKIEKGAKYKVSFDAKAADGKTIAIKVGAIADRAWEAYAQQNIKLTGNWESYEFEFTMMAETNEMARFEFWFIDTGIYELDNIKLVKVEENAISTEGTKTEADEDLVEDWELVWSDEFDEIREDVWTFEVGNGHKQGIPGWGNNELQYYTDGDNAHIKDGKLVITAKEEEISDSHGSYNYTSTRMITKGKFSMKYGRVEVRAKMPEGKGIWPAIWMLGTDIDENPWPACGEIDIAEVIGNTPNIVHGTIHGPISTYTGISAGYILPDGKKFSDDFHIFALEWDEDELEFYVDDVLYHVVNKDEVGGQEWVYDKPLFFILNVAVGGNLPGYPDGTTEFPQTMEVDYIRVYEDKDPASIDGEERWDSEYELKWREMKEKEESSKEKKNADLTINRVVNGAFDSEIVNDVEAHRDNWYVLIEEGGEVNSFGVENGEFIMDIANPGSKASNVQFAQCLKLEPGSIYKVSFDARAEDARDINVKMLHPTKHTVYGEETIGLNPTMESYSLEVEFPGNVSEVVNLSFELGALSDQSKATRVYLDNVKIEKIRGVNYTEYGNCLLDNGELLFGNPDYHAISYSGYRKNVRRESTVPTVEQIKDDMKILEAMGVKLLRTYNTNEFSQSEKILKAISELKEEDPDFEMYVMLGAWISCEGAYTDSVNHNVEDEDKNKGEIDKAIELAAKYPQIVKAIAVGNEAMVRWQAHYVPAEVILKWVNYLREARENGDIPGETLITSSDNFAAWGGEGSYRSKTLKDLVKAVDFVSLHTYPFHDTHYVSKFWKTPEENKDLSDKEKIDNAMKRAFERAKNQYQLVKEYVRSIDPEKPIHIGETGWASVSTDLYGSGGSRAADEYKQKQYYDQIREWSDACNISVFFFEGFDEPWKGSNNPGHSEKHFGLFTVDGKAKYVLWDLVDKGIFDGLTRDGNPVKKTYNGDESALMEDVLTPPLAQNHTAGAAVTEDTYVVLDTKKNTETNSYLAIPAIVNPWEGTCGMGLTDDGIVEITTGTGNWWGCGLEIREGVNLSNFANGHLHFDIKGDTSSSFNIGFQTGVYGSSERPQTNNYVTFGPGRSYQLTRNWKSYSIPVSELMKGADLTDVTSLLYLMGDANFDGRKIYVKNVYYTQD